MQGYPMNEHRQSYVDGTDKEVRASIHELDTSVVPSDPEF